MTPKRDEQRRLAALLHRLAECIDNASSDQINELVIGRARLNIEPVRRQQRLDSAAGRKQSGDKDWAEVAEKLRTLDSRDAGERLVIEVAPSRADLERLARSMDLPVTKQDNAQHLREKVIEATIGSRLVSKAIRGGSQEPSRR